MLTVVKNVRNGALSYIKSFFYSEGFFFRKIDENSFECIKKISKGELPKIHFKIYNLEKSSHIRIYSHMDYKKHVREVITYNGYILEIDSKLRKFLKKKEKGLKINSVKNKEFKKNPKRNT